MSIKTRDPEILVTQDQLKALLSYDRMTGLMSWIGAYHGRPPGSEAGKVNAKGYVELYVLGKRYLLHRLAFLYETGTHPLRSGPYRRKPIEQHLDQSSRCISKREFSKREA